MSVLAAERFALEPLLPLVDDTTKPWERVGVTRRVWQRVVTRGWLSTYQADAYAIRAGSHPALLWPEWLRNALEQDPHREPEEAYPMTNATASTWLRRVQALLAKAESTDSLPEAEALYAKAQSLMVKHAIEEADLLAARDGSERVEIVGVDFTYSPDDRFRPGKTTLLGVVARNSRVKYVAYAGSKRAQRANLVGSVADVEFVQHLYTSLLIHALSDAAKAWAREGQYLGGTKHTWTSHFLVEYGVRVGQLLDERRRVDEGVAEAGNLPMLYDAVAAKFKELHPDARTKRSSIRGAHGASQAGRAAAERADLSGGRGHVGSTRRALSR